MLISQTIRSYVAYAAITQIARSTPAASCRIGFQHIRVGQPSMHQTNQGTQIKILYRKGMICYYTTHTQTVQGFTKHYD